MPDKELNPKMFKAMKTVAAAGDTIRTPKGNVVTKEQWKTAAKNGLAFNTHQEYADYVENWSHPIKEEKKEQKATPKKQDYFDQSGGRMRWHQ